MIISVEVKKDGYTYTSLDAIPSMVVIHAHDALPTLNRTLEELKTPERQAMGGSTSGVTNGVFFNFRLHNVNPAKFYEFVDTYANFLYANYKANVANYAMEYDKTLEMMKIAILKGTANKDSDSFKQTCKALKIKHTYKAIDEFLGRVK